MLPNQEFQKQDKSFWSQVKLVSMTLGYSSGDKIKLYTISEIVDCLNKLNLSTDHLIDSSGSITIIGQLLVNYFKFRSEVLHTVAEPSLMNRDQAKAEFDKIYNSYSPRVILPYNKQKGEKRHRAYLTCIINMLTEKTLGNLNFDANPGELIVVTKNEKPLRVLSRRFDGAYPSTINPYSLWEIKEYYGTTTFGSRVADGVYETLLDGAELEELRMTENIDIKHYLIVDDYFTWWKKGKSYLCRLIDLLHQGYLDEVIFGKEAISRWPEIVKSWPTNFTTSTVDDREHLLQS